MCEYVRAARSKCTRRKCEIINPATRCASSVFVFVAEATLKPLPKEPYFALYGLDVESRQPGCERCERGCLVLVKVGLQSKSGAGAGEIIIGL